MLMDRQPSVKDSDDYIRAWSMLHNHKNLPQHRVQLVGAVRLDQPDIAVVHWDERGHPVRREKSREAGA